MLAYWQIYWERKASCLLGMAQRGWGAEARQGGEGEREAPAGLRGSKVGECGMRAAAAGGFSPRAPLERDRRAVRGATHVGHEVRGRSGMSVE